MASQEYTPTESEKAELLSELVARHIPETIGVVILTESGYHISHDLPHELLLLLLDQIVDELRVQVSN
jgi:hypothetical protein